jgi:hypothetical protein
MKAIDLETRYSAHNYALLSVVPTRGQGAYLWDTAGATLRRHGERLPGGEQRHGYPHNAGPTMLCSVVALRFAKALTGPTLALPSVRTSQPSWERLT